MPPCGCGAVMWALHSQGSRESLRSFLLQKRVPVWSNGGIPRACMVGTPCPPLDAVTEVGVSQRCRFHGTQSWLCCARLPGICLHGGTSNFPGSQGLRSGRPQASRAQKGRRAPSSGISVQGRSELSACSGESISFSLQVLKVESGQGAVSNARKRWHLSGKPCTWPPGCGFCQAMHPTWQGPEDSRGRCPELSLHQKQNWVSWFRQVGRQPLSVSPNICSHGWHEPQEAGLGLVTRVLSKRKTWKTYLCWA